MAAERFSNMKTFGNILIVRTDRIGDVVLTTPAFKALRRAYPAARISVLVAEATRDLVQGNPYIDEVLTDDRQGQHRGPLGLLRLVRQIRSKAFDLAIIYHTKRRYNLACALAQIPVRLGYKNEKWGFFLTMPLKDTRPSGQKHEAQYCLDVLKALGIENDSLDLFVPLQKEAETWALSWMQGEGLQNHGFIVVHPGSSDPAKCWPPADFALLMDRLIEQYAVKIILIGSAPTLPVAEEILRLMRRQSQVINRTGKTSLAQTVSLLRRASLLISNDSGPVHLAAGVGTSVISLFLRNQPGINPGRWRPLGPKSHFLCGDPKPFKAEDVLHLAHQLFQKNNQYEIF